MKYIIFLTIISLASSLNIHALGIVHEFETLVKESKSSSLDVLNKLSEGGQQARTLLKQPTPAFMPVVIKCYTKDCAPCKRTEAPFKKLAEDYKGKAHFIKIDVEKFREVGNQLNVKTAPSFFICFPYKRIERIGGSRDIQKIKTVLDEFLRLQK
jgi:thioredoxin 1